MLSTCFKCENFGIDHVSVTDIILPSGLSCKHCGKCPDGQQSLLDLLMSSLQFDAILGRWRGERRLRHTIQLRHDAVLQGDGSQVWRAKFLREFACSD